MLIQAFETDAHPVRGKCSRQSTVQHRLQQSKQVRSDFKLKLVSCKRKPAVLPEGPSCTKIISNLVTQLLLPAAHRYPRRGLTTAPLVPHAGDKKILPYRLAQSSRAF